MWIEDSEIIFQKLEKLENKYSWVFPTLPKCKNLYLWIFIDLHYDLLITVCWFHKMLTILYFLQHNLSHRAKYSNDVWLCPKKTFSHVNLVSWCKCFKWFLFDDLYIFDFCFTINKAKFNAEGKIFRNKQFNVFRKILSHLSEICILMCF